MLSGIIYKRLTPESFKHFSHVWLVNVVWCGVVRWCPSGIIWKKFTFSFFRFLDSISVAAIGYFRESAEKLIEERGAVDALAAALAHISGATALQQRSLLSSDAVSLSRTSACRNSNPSIFSGAAVSSCQHMMWRDCFVLFSGLHHSAADVLHGDAQHRICLENPERAAWRADRDPHSQDDFP